jgi:transcriptional regulator of acetoin/glycerol metabolism
VVGAVGTLTDLTAFDLANERVAILDEQGERRRLLDTLQKTGGKRSEAARTLGFGRVTLWKKMRRFGIDDKRQQDVDLLT